VEPATLEGVEGKEPRKQQMKSYEEQERKIQMRGTDHKTKVG